MRKDFLECGLPCPRRRAAGPFEERVVAVYYEMPFDAPAPPPAPLAELEEKLVVARLAVEIHKRIRPESRFSEPLRKWVLAHDRLTLKVEIIEGDIRCRWNEVKHPNHKF